MELHTVFSNGGNLSQSIGKFSYREILPNVRSKRDAHGGCCAGNGTDTREMEDKMASAALSKGALPPFAGTLLLLSRRWCWCWCGLCGRRGCGGCFHDWLNLAIQLNERIDLQLHRGDVDDMLLIRRRAITFL